MYHFKDRDSDIHRISSIADQRASVTADVAKGEEVAPNGDGLVQGEPEEDLKPDVIVEDDVEDWDLEGIMMAEDVNASGLRAKNACTAGEFSLQKHRGPGN